MDPILVKNIVINPNCTGFCKEEAPLQDEDEICGAWVSIRPINDNKTYLGVYLGNLFTNIGAYFDHSTNTLNIKSSKFDTNPAIYVPDLKRVVMGYESWWGIIKSPEELKQISDIDIQNVWYVKALKELSEKI